MSNPASVQLIDTLARDGASRGLMFSAQDIVIAAWQRGVLLAPEDVLSRLQALVQQGALADGYTWSDWKGRGVIVFHRIGDDPRQYKLGGGPTKPGGQGIFDRLMQALSNLIFPPPPAEIRRQTPPIIQTDRGPVNYLDALGLVAAIDDGDLTRGVANPVRSAPQNASTPPPKSKKLGLDAAQFLPINREEQKEAVSKINLWGSAFFGRRV